MMPNGINKEDCTGCRACALACPVNCIHMVMDKEGFWYPEFTDWKKCIRCNLCKKKCHVLTDTYNVEQKTGFGFVSKDIGLLRNSTSGGVFSLLAKSFTDENQWVFGSVYDNEFNVVTLGSNKFSDVKLMCGSKYIFNDTGQSYREMKKLLNNNEKVLYCGVPCQIAGLKAYLGKEYSNLFLIDILCHGGPSTKLFQIYLRWVEKKHKKKVVSYVFRDKKYGRRTIATVTFDDGEEFKMIPRNDPYLSSFYKGKTYRKSCYKCKYACRKRVGDMTIGDYWGAEEYHHDIDVSKGFSAVIINNGKGKELLELVRSNAVIIDTTVEKIAANNETLNQPTKPYIYRDEIYEGIYKNKFLYIANKYMYAEERWKTAIKSLVPENIKRIMRKIVKNG